MNWYLLLLTVIVLSITPISFETLLTFGTGNMPNGYFILRVWHTGLPSHFRFERDGKGTLQLKLKGKKERTAPQPDVAKQYQQVKTIIAAIKRANIAEKTLKKAIHFHLLDAFALIGLSDAAKTAELTGVLCTFQSLLPPGVRNKIKIRADFRGASHIRIHCILTARVGMLLSAMVLGLLAYQKERKRIKEEEKWKNLQSAI